LYLKEIEGSGEWKIVHDMDLGDLSGSPSDIWAVKEGNKNCIKISVGKLLTKCTHRRSKKRWEVCTLK
jgi:hypothetical protein